MLACVLLWLGSDPFYPYPLGLLHSPVLDNYMIAPVAVKFTATGAII